MISFRPCLFAGLLSVSLAGASFHGSYAQAETPAAIMLAQNDEGGGFWDRLFNRSDRQSGAKPLFLDTPGLSPSPQVRPFNYNSTVSSSGPYQRLTPEQALRLREQRDLALMQQGKMELAIVMEDIRKIQVARERRQAQQMAGRGSNAEKEQQNKKMVYDPERVWQYDPNRRDAPQSEQERPRIFNTR